MAAARARGDSEAASVVEAVVPRPNAPLAAMTIEAIEIGDHQMEGAAVEFLALSRGGDDRADELSGVSASGDRLSAIAAAGGIAPLVGLLSNGSQIGRTRAASALWHLAANPKLLKHR